ncbi:MAG: GNAT family N-acetyltransferase [Acetobacteraceae bacterium]
MHSTVVQMSDYVQRHQLAPLFLTEELAEPHLASGLRLRPVLDSDASRIIGLITNICSEYSGRIVRVQRHMPELRAPARFYRERDGQLWLLDSAEGIVGMIAMKPGMAAGAMEVEHLYVRRSYREQGLGTLLCGLVEQEALCRRCTSLELWSDVELLEANRLYERLGYVRDSSGLDVGRGAAATCRFYRKRLDPARARDPARLARLIREAFP